MYLLTTWDAFQMVPSFPRAHFMVWMIPKGKNSPWWGAAVWAIAVFGNLFTQRLRHRVFWSWVNQFGHALRVAPPKKKTLKPLQNSDSAQKKVQNVPLVVVGGTRNSHGDTNHFYHIQRTSDVRGIEVLWAWAGFGIVFSLQMRR